MSGGGVRESGGRVKGSGGMDESEWREGKVE